MAGELGAVVEGDGLAPGGRQGREEAREGAGDGGGGFGGRADGEEQAGVTVVEGEDGLAVDAEEHEVGFPVPGGLAIGGTGGTLGEGPTVLNKGGGAAPLAPAAAPFVLGAGEIVAPGAVVGAADLGVDKAVDGLVRDDRPASVAGQAPGDLCGRPPLLEAGEDLGAQGGVAIKPGPAPAAGMGLLVGVARLVALGAGGIAPQFPSNRRWRAIQSCRDLAARGAGGVASGHFTPVFNGEM